MLQLCIRRELPPIVVAVLGFFERQPIRLIITQSKYGIRSAHKFIFYAFYERKRNSLTIPNEIVFAIAHA